MHASTRSISLVLLGSALALAGCHRDKDKDEANGAHGGVGHVYMGGSGVRSGGGTATSSTAGASARGGFGGIGAAAGASSAS